MPLSTPESEDAYEEALHAKAMFCLVTGIAPSEYDGLTDDELDAFIEAHNDLHRS